MVGTTKRNVRKYASTQAKWHSPMIPCQSIQLLFKPPYVTSRQAVTLSPARLVQLAVLQLPPVPLPPFPMASQHSGSNTLWLPPACQAEIAPPCRLRLPLCLHSSQWSSDSGPSAIVARCRRVEGLGRQPGRRPCLAEAREAMAAEEPEAAEVATMIAPTTAAATRQTAMVAVAAGEATAASGAGGGLGAGEEGEEEEVLRARL